jgi:hypothetical protein
MKRRKPNRRQVLQVGALVGGGFVAGHGAQALAAEPRTLGEPLGPYGERSPFETATRWRRESKTPETGSSFTPLHESVGTLTPSALHYERHHSGIPTIDPSEHRLIIPGGCRRSPVSSRSSAAATVRGNGWGRAAPTCSEAMAS